jgi:hypothetical protein
MKQLLMIVALALAGCATSGLPDPATNPAAYSRATGGQFDCDDHPERCDPEAALVALADLDRAYDAIPHPSRRQNREYRRKVAELSKVAKRDAGTAQ